MTKHEKRAAVAAEAIELPLTDPAIEPEHTPHQRRNMLIEGAKDFDAKVQPEAPAELVDRMVAEGKISLRTPRPDDEEADEFNWNDSGCVVLTEQYATAIYFNPAGELVIRQRRWPDEDQFVFINRGCADTFIDKLNDALGVPSFGGPDPTPPPVRKS